jgi:hypothetical protein
MPVKSLGRGKGTKAGKKKNLTRKKNNTKRKDNKRKTRTKKGGWSLIKSIFGKPRSAYETARKRASKLPLGSRKYTLTRPADQTPLTDKERQEIQEIKTKRLKYLPDTKRKR